MCYKGILYPQEWPWILKRTKKKLNNKTDSIHRQKSVDDTRLFITQNTQGQHNNDNLENNDNNLICTKGHTKDCLRNFHTNKPIDLTHNSNLAQTLKETKTYLNVRTKNKYHKRQLKTTIQNATCVQFSPRWTRLFAIFLLLTLLPRVTSRCIT